MLLTTVGGFNEKKFLKLPAADLITTRKTVFTKYNYKVNR